MSMFPLSIFCLTTSNLPLMDLTFQVPMLCCSLQHQTLLHHQSQPHLGVVLLLAPSLHSFWSYFPLFSISIFVTYQPEEFMFQCYIFLLFILFMGFSRQEYWSGLPFSSPVDHVLPELSTMSHQSWEVLYSMAHSFMELDKAVIHVISLVSFLQLWFSFYLPSDR